MDVEAVRRCVHSLANAGEVEGAAALLLALVNACGEEANRTAFFAAGGAEAALRCLRRWPSGGSLTLGACQLLVVTQAFARAPELCTADVAEILVSLVSGGAGGETTALYLQTVLSMLAVADRSAPAWSSICDRLEKALNVLLTGIGQSADQGNTSPIRALRIDPHRRIVEVVNVHRSVQHEQAIHAELAEHLRVRPWHYGAFASVLPTTCVAIHELSRVEGRRCCVWVRDDVSGEMRASVPAFRVQDSIYFVDVGYVVFYSSREPVEPPAPPRVEWFDAGSYVQPRGFAVRIEQVLDSMQRLRLRSTRSNGCAVCASAINLKLCGHCGTVRYCSKECQRLDWKNGHREACVPR